MFKSLLSERDITREDFAAIMKKSAIIKAERDLHAYRPLENKSIGMIFARSSTRTRVSFDVGISELGGKPLYLEQGKMQMGRGETIADTAKVLSRYLHGIVIRTYSQADVEELSRESHIPVINALTDDFHPCQILTDLFTIAEYSGSCDGIKLAFFGDGRSNMANSFIQAAALCDIEIVICAPKEFSPNMELAAPGTKVKYIQNPLEAAKNADYLYTDVWVSMGVENEATERMNLLRPYQVNMDLIRVAKPNVKVMHCLPAHRGEEISADVMDSDYSIVFDEAENRLHVQKAIMGLIFENLAK